MEWFYDRATGERASIKDGDRYIPLDPDNTDYQEIMRQVEAGELTIAPSVDPDAPA